jgi:hypothetical protein
MDLKRGSNALTPALSLWEKARKASAAMSTPISAGHPRTFLELRMVV